MKRSKENSYIRVQNRKPSNTNPYICLTFDLWVYRLTQTKTSCFSLFLHSLCECDVVGHVRRRALHRPELRRGTERERERLWLWLGSKDRDIDDHPWPRGKSQNFWDVQVLGSSGMWAMINTTVETLHIFGGLSRSGSSHERMNTFISPHGEEDHVRYDPRHVANNARARIHKAFHLNAESTPK